jgi:hypothetical protein
VSARLPSFWECVDVRGPDDCWEWQRGRVGAGYGVCRDPGTGKRVYAHRMALMLSGRPLGTVQVGRHTCDNPPCCNPRHLLPGTQKDNSADAAARGRAVAPPPPLRGEAHPASKLTDRLVREIRAMRAAGHSFGHVATTFGVSKKLVMNIVKGRAWTHVI